MHGLCIVLTSIRPSIFSLAGEAKLLPWNTCIFIQELLQLSLHILLYEAELALRDFFREPSIASIHPKVLADEGK